MTQFTDITAEEIDALIKRLEEADLHQFVLASEDVQLIIAALSSLVNLQDNIASKGSSLDKLRRLCGLFSPRKKTKNAADDDCSSRSHGAKQNKNARSKPKPNVEPIPETVVFHALKNYKRAIPVLSASGNP